MDEQPQLTSPAIDYLERRGLAYHLHQHTGLLHSVEQAAAERDQRPEQVIRSILFRLEEGEYVLVLMPGTYRVSWPALRNYLGRRRLTLAEPEEVLAVTGYRVGTVSPFGLVQTVRGTTPSKRGLS